MITITAHDTFLDWTEKGGQRAKQWRDRVLQQKDYSMGNKLDHWTNIYGS